MASLAHLLLVACTLVASLHAASIDVQKKIPAPLPDEIKQPSDISPPHELADLSEPVKEIENELRAKPSEAIPVAVVVEDVEPSMKINEVADEEEINRPQADLRNPGPPQRQEHETQNPEQHSDELLKVSTIKENIEQTQNLLRLRFQGVTDDIEHWANNDDQIKIQQDIQNLRDTFTAQIQKLNDTIQTLAKPDEAKMDEKQGEQPKRDYKKIESDLKTLEDNFNNEVETLSAGVQIVGSLRSAVDDSEVVREEAPAQPAEPAPPAQPTSPAQPAQPAPPAQSGGQNFIIQAINAWYNRTVENFQYIQDSLSLSPTTPASVQADQPDGTTTRPSILQQFAGYLNFSNPLDQFLRPNGTRPFGQIFGANATGPTFPNLGQYFTPPNTTYSLPTIGQWPGIGNLFNRPEATTAKPAEASTAEPASTSAPEKPEEPKPEGEYKPSEAPAANPPASQGDSQANGPIRQFLNNSPVVQSIAGAVQRLQNTITNPERPREPAEKSDISVKDGWHNKKPSKPTANGDNNSNRVSEQKSEDIKEKPTVQEEPKKEEVKPEVSDKTE